MKVVAACHSHESGSNFRVFLTEEQATEWRAEIAKEYWTQETGKELEDGEELSDEEIEEYWETVQQKESFIHEVVSLEIPK